MVLLCKVYLRPTGFVWQNLIWLRCGKFVMCVKRRGVILTVHKSGGSGTAQCRLTVLLAVLHMIVVGM